MAQKKPTPPFPVEQHSSSSDDEVSGEQEATPLEQADSSSSDDEQTSSGEDEEDVTPVNKPTEQHSSSSDDSEEEEEPYVTPVAPVKPVVVVQSTKVRGKQQQPDLSPALLSSRGKKRAREESQAADKNISKKFKKRVDEDVVKKVGDYPQSKLIQRLFNEKDEIAILNALLKYSAKKSIDPIEDKTDFHNFVKKSIHFDVTESQLSSKIQKMKSKYKKNARKSKETFGKAHDQSCYDLSKKIWQKSSSACGGSELKTTRKGKRIPKTKNMTPGLQIPQVVEEPVHENISLSELSKTRDAVVMMWLSEDAFKKGLELLRDDEARAAYEDKMKNMVTAQLELSYKRLELSRELMKLFPGHRG